MTSVPGSAALFPGEGELAALMRRKDWSSTSLGAVERWPHALRAAVRIVLTSRFSMWMAWGDELAFLYNDAYRTDTLGAKHPWALGMPAREVWSEIWSEVGPRISSVLADGRATWDEGLMLMLERSGYREETYHTFSYSPLHDDEGVVRGMLCVVNEETARMISERRVELLGKLAAEIAVSNTERAVLTGLERTLASESRDLPFSLTYLFADDGTTARLVAHTGFSATDPEPAGELVVDAASPWGLDEVVASGRAIEVTLTGSSWPAGPWPTSPSSALVVPLARQGQQVPAGVFIAGINPHRRFDAAYREFVLLYAGQLAAGLANADAYEHERRRAESLAELDRAKTAFFSNVSHEFRTPLTLILGPLGGLLADPELAPTLRDELTTIHRNTLRLLKLVNTMLDFSRIEAGRATAEFQRVDLAQLTTDLASVFRAAIERAGMRLVVDCSPLDTAVYVDPDMWEKIVLNLISNAFKFTLDGEIVVGLARVGDRVQLVVSDSGGGIPSDQLDRVFERFHRVEGSKGRTHEGTGIGLALVQELARLHGGTVEVASELGRGATFTVTIPLARPPTAPEPAPTSARERGPNPFVEEALRWLPATTTATATTATETETTAASPARERLLVADDNADMRDYLARVLGQRWELETVANGREALAAIHRRRPDLVITDVMMPELDGLGLVAALRADAATRDLPVIMLSARAGESSRIEGLQGGANDYLVKPFAARELIAHVETQLLRAAVRTAELAQAQRLAAILEQAPVAIAILRGPEHVFEIANPPYLALVERTDVVGQPVARALPEVVEQGFVDLLDRVYRSGEPFIGRSVAVTLRHGADDRTREVVLDFIYQPLLDGDGVVSGIAVIVHDVTALATAREGAEAANRTKDEFLAMLGHELRNPLAPITTALQLMRLRPDVGAERERAVIERQVNHLVGLVDDLLDISRIARGNLVLRSEAVELAEVVARAVEAVSPLLEEQHHVLAVEVAAGLVVRGDATRLVQVVSNLLTNAAKYTPRGGRIGVTARREDAAIALVVTDSGIGIEPAMLRRIFEPFAQAPQALDRALGGLGLGLAIVKNLVALHGGTVTATSRGRELGSEFTVSLPAIEKAQVLSSPGPDRSVIAPAGARVLVVDDNVDAAEMLTTLLELGGYDVRSAHDGPSALIVAADFRPQVAVLDLGLPVMDGYELARLLRAQSSQHPIELVALTGYGQADDRARSAAAGFSAHLVKPVDVEQLHRVIEGLLAAPPR